MTALELMCSFALWIVSFQLLRFGAPPGLFHILRLVLHPLNSAAEAYHPLKCIFSSVACFILSSLNFLLALERLHPLKLDEVGFCVVATFKTGGGLVVGFVPCFCFARWLAHSRAPVLIVFAASHLFAGLYWWRCKSFLALLAYFGRLTKI